MRFSTFIFPLTILAAGLVLASPLEERGTKVSEVPSASEPKYEVISVKPNPASEGAHVEGGGKGVTAKKPSKSKRSDHNELDGRSTPYGTLLVCPDYGCGGYCYGYSLPVNSYVCTWVYWYNSFYISAYDGLTYGVFVGNNCGDWSFVPYVNTCYDIYPTGNTFYIN